MNSSFIRSIIGLCLLSMFIFPLTALGAEGDASSGSTVSTGPASGDLVWPDPGAIRLNKTAEPTGKFGEWKITLTAEGKNFISKSSADVVLVIDKSVSMRGDSIGKAKESAKRFVDNLLQEGADTRIAVVSFNQIAVQDSAFKGYADKASLKEAIEQLSASGGTNIQAGLKVARELLASSTAEHKIVVLLSDGYPNYSFKGTKATDASWPEDRYRYAITDFDYGVILGGSKSFKYIDYGCVDQTCKNDSYEIEGYKVLDNGIATLSEANFVKQAGFELYAIGLNIIGNRDAEYVLNHIQNKGYFSAGTEDLSGIFRELTGTLIYAAEDAVVTDPMGEMFQLKLQDASFSEKDFTVSQGAVTWNGDTETLTWNIGKIIEGEPATLTYVIKMDFAKNPVASVLYPTNGVTTISFKDINKEKATKEFVVPKVSIELGGTSNPGNPGSQTPVSGSNTPPLPPLPPVPPKLDADNHYDYLSGYPDGTIRPENNITRAEAATIFYRLLDDESRFRFFLTANSFSDLENSHWSVNPVSTLENARVVNGYPDKSFRPDNYITRAEFAAIASRFDKLEEADNKDQFTDIAGHWAKPYIASSAQKGWIKGYPDGSFKPDQYITRAEAVSYINKVLNRGVDEERLLDDVKQWPDSLQGKWYYYDILEASNHHSYTREEEELEIWGELKPSRTYP